MLVEEEEARPRAAMASSCLYAPYMRGGLYSPVIDFSSPLPKCRISIPSMSRLAMGNSNSGRRSRIKCGSSFRDDSSGTQPQRSGVQLYRDIERLLTSTAKQSQDTLGTSKDWKEVEGTWVLGPQNTKPRLIVHFIGGVFVGAAPQLTYRLFLERLVEKDILVIATPYASGFDHNFIADEVQFKFDRCLRFLQAQDLPIFGIGHSLGSVIHLLIGSRYAVERSGNILMSFNNKDASLAIPLLSPFLVPMAQSIGPFLSQVATSPTVRLGAEVTVKQLETLSPAIMKQVLPLVEQLPPLYMDLINGRENFIPRPEDTKKLIRSYYGISRNLLIKFKDDTIDETPVVAQLLSTDSAVSSMLDMCIRTLPGSHGLPLHQVMTMTNAGEQILANLTAGTPWESIAKEVGSALGRVDSNVVDAQESKHLDLLVCETTSWMASNFGPRLLPSSS